MRKLYLHCGAHKTGTTTIQSSLARAKAELENCGVQYFTPNELTAGGVYRGMLEMRADNCELDKYIDSVNYFFIKNRRYNEKDQNHILISSESFFSWVRLSIEDLKNDRNFYDNMERSATVFANLNLFDEFKIRFYIRRQDTFLESLYFEYLQRGNIDVSFEEYCRLEPYKKMSWRRLLYILELNFGLDAIEVVPFESIAGGAQAFLSSFYKWVDVPQSFVIPEPTHERQRFSKLAYEIALKVWPLLEIDERRAFSIFLSERYPAKKYGKPNLLSKEKRKEILDFHWNDNLYIFDRYRIAFSPQQYHPDAVQ